MKTFYAVMTSVLFISSLLAASASEQQPKSKEQIRVERQKAQEEQAKKLEQAEKEMAEHKAKITARCPQEIPMTKMMDVKNNGSTEIEGHHYYPYNKDEFSAQAPYNWQLKTHKEIAKFKEKAIGDKGVWVCKYTYKTFSGYDYELELVDAGPQIK